MDIATFEAKYGKVWCKGLRDNIFQKDLKEGMLQFTEDTHFVLAHSFHGFGYYRTTHFLNVNHPTTGLPVLQTIAQTLQQGRFSPYRFPLRFGYKDPAQSEEHLQKRLALLTDKERKEWERHQGEHNYIEYATVEKPYRLYICGNDDSSYSKFYATEAEMNEELALYEACQPLDFYNDLTGFVFTN